jgi:hypothetical protein
VKLSAVSLPYALSASAGTPLSDRDVLRALVDGADLLGMDRNEGAFLLVRTTPQLLEYLATMDAAVEDAEGEEDDEENGDGQRVDSQLVATQISGACDDDEEDDASGDSCDLGEDDGCVDQPDFQSRILEPTHHDAMEAFRMGAWIQTRTAAG